MDTSRIKINIIDNSSTLVEESTTVTGFTVVKAPKGPITPVKLAAGSVAKIKDIFGESSAEYPELFEVETFNKEYDVWVSAPYSESSTKVPVAYLTKNGVFASDNTIPYNLTLEKLIKGELEGNEEGIEGVNSFTGNYSLLMDTRYPRTNFTYKEGAGENVIKDIISSNPYPGIYPVTAEEGVDQALVINTGLSISQIKKIGIFGTITETAEGAVFKIKGLTRYSDTYSLVFGSAVGEGTIYSGNNISDAYKVGTIKTYKNGSYSDITSDDADVVYLFINGGSGDSSVITQAYIREYLNQESEREGLLTYWKKKVDDPDSEFRAAILPKYPSSRALHIGFSAFSEITGYKKTSYSSRNILKMTVYEDDAFHNANHKINVNGSIDSKAVDANGSPIGFNSNNSSYYNQELVFVHSIKPFVKEDEGTFNSNVNCYPAIKLDGGKRNTEITDEFTSMDLHNIGWELAKGSSEYSDVDIFFDSAVHDESLVDLKNKDTFFSMVSSDVDSHKLAGYIFNYTPSVVPSSINDQLTFGRNYWNICNIAVTDLGNGDRIFSPMTGARALMQCRIIENKWGGVAPMWENTGSPAMGGQLTMINPYRLKYKYSKSDLDAFDLYNYNPVISDRQYGIMVVGQKTCKDGDVTDWSYIGHACSFLTFIKQIRNNTMLQQIGKPNSPYYRTLRKEQVQRYLDERLTGDGRIWAEGSVDTSTADGVNDVYALEARKFVINVKVKVDVFSEYVELNFTNEDQKTTISVANE